MNIPNDFNPMGINKESGIPTKGLDWYCPFQTNFNDVINNYSGSGPGSSYFYVGNDTSSNIGNCLIAQCTKNQGIDYANTGGLFQYGTGDFSVSFWLQAPYWPDYPENCVLSKKANDNDTGFVIYRDGGSKNYMTFRLPGTDVITTTVAKNPRWVSWIFIRKDGIAYWYRNGILDKSISCNGSANSTDIFRIGFHGQWTTRAYYNLKALRIYNRALTPKQINDLANEFDVKYYILANNQTFDFYPYPTNQSQQIQISTALGTSGYTFSYQIISGTLPSGLTLNSSNGYINGYVNVDADTNYNLVVRVSSTSTELLPKDVNVTIVAHKETILTVTTPQTFNFTTQAYTNTAVSCNTNGLVPTVTLSDNLPSGVYLNVPPSPAGYVSIYSTGTQTSAESSTVTASFTTQYHPTPVTATLNINVALNQITASNRTAKFYTLLGTQTYQVKYTSQKTITPVFTLSGTLPSGITFDTSTGTFTYDGTNTTAGTTAVQVTIASSTGHSTTATAEITLAIVEGSGIQNGLVFYAPLTDDLTTYTGGTNFRTAGCSIATIDGKNGLHFASQSYSYGYAFQIPNFTMTNGPFTFSMWYCFENLVVPYSNMALYYLGRRTPNKQIGVEITRSSKAPQMAWGPDPYTQIYTNNFVLNGDNHWHSFNMAYDGTYLTYYHDGVKIGQFSLGSLDITDKNLWIGSRGDDSRSWLGLINNFAIHNYCFAQSDVDNYISVTQ